MADKETSTKDEVIEAVDESVETTTDEVVEDENLDDEQDDTSEDDAESNDDGDDDSDDESDEDSDDEDEDDDSEDEDEPEFKKAFSQIKGDSPEEYIPNLEKAYRDSSREGKRLSGEMSQMQARLDSINQAVAKDPKLAEAINNATGSQTNPTVDPALLEIRQEREAKMAKSYDDFVDAHPELDEDEELQAELIDNLKIIGAQARQQNKAPNMEESLKKAWAMMGKGDAKPNVAEVAKGSASKSKTAPAKKTKAKGKPKLSSEQIAYGKKFGLTEKQMLEYASSE